MQIEDQNSKTAEVDAREFLASVALQERGYRYVGFGEWKRSDGVIVMSQTAKALVDYLVWVEMRG